MNNHISVAIFNTRYNLSKINLIKTNETKHEYAFNRSERIIYINYSFAFQRIYYFWLWFKSNFDLSRDEKTIRVSRRGAHLIPSLI
jgi:hypothetical protein